MQRPLKRQAIKPVRHTCTVQQRNVDPFRREYNDERPHEALGVTATEVTLHSRAAHSSNTDPDAGVFGVLRF